MFQEESNFVSCTFQSIEMIFGDSWSRIHEPSGAYCNALFVSPLEK
ncbi:hypothetical protein EHQ58_07055 [Leptospira ognonensis]|uniref:Uncharacterized protein n=1 Tax=Leptospira ognonensis TaxID=2484945 RepID=A0A4R9K427_9LEPT|nr:hypothetical protein EHQ58_07055 [Leptospira ognonensis]